MAKRPPRRLAIGTAALAAAAVAAAASVTALAAGRDARPANAYTVHRLASDRSDPALVNAWGLAASATGPWWTANEARDASTLYSGAGRKQALTVAVAGGPTGIVYNGGPGFRVAGGGRSAPARFVYASEDGALRGWAPTVPGGWSTASEVVVDAGAEAAIFRGLALARLPGGGQRLYATDFHNGRVDVFDGRWRRIRSPGAFADPRVPEWYAPFGIHVLAGRVFVTYAWRAPVNGNDAPTGGYVDEFDLTGRLVARVGRLGPLNAPWGAALAPRGFGALAGDLLVGNFGDGRINAFARRPGGGWSYRGPLRGRDGKPVVLNGLWSLAFGNGAAAGPRGTLFFTSGPHTWRGETESGVHGLLGSIEPAR